MNANIIKLVNVGVKGGAVVTPSITKNGQIVTTDYGKLDKGVDSSFYITLSPLSGDKILNVKTSTSCGCTTASPKLVGGEVIILVKYDTKRIGNINKTVTLSFDLNGDAQKIFFKLTGKVVSE